jgi:hypothetical protein
MPITGVCPVRISKEGGAVTEAPPKKRVLGGYVFVEKYQVDFKDLWPSISHYQAH